MSPTELRLYELLDSWFPDGSPDLLVEQLLAAEGLLVTDEPARLIRLGEAVEYWRSRLAQYPLNVRYVGWNECLDGIYAEANSSTERPTP